MQFRDLQKQYAALKPDIDDAIESVCMNTNFIQGAEVVTLANELADYVGVEHCVPCANGTDALSLALMAWNIGPGDAVFVPDFTFFSTAEAPAALGATPIFVDVESDTYNIDPVKLEQSILKTIANTSLNPRVVISVDLFGLPANYEALKNLCETFGLLLLEDAAQGFGGSINGKQACSFGDMSTTSFFPAKPLGCYGDGGAIFTDNLDWNSLLTSYANHGKGTEKYDNVRVGMNSRLDTIQAAILQRKLAAFAEYELKDINEKAGYYTKGLSGTQYVLPYIPKGYLSSWAQYTIQVPDSMNRDDLKAYLANKGIPSMVYYPKPLHEQTAFRSIGHSFDGCPISCRLSKAVLSLPIHPYLDIEEQDCVLDALLSFK